MVLKFFYQSEIIKELRFYIEIINLLKFVFITKKQIVEKKQLTTLQIRLTKYIKMFLQMGKKKPGFSFLYFYDKINVNHFVLYVCVKQYYLKGTNSEPI